VIKRLLRQRNDAKETNINPIPVGSQAPELVLVSESGDTVALDDFLGRPVVLVFYPADNTSVCASQLALYNEAYQMFEAYDAQLLAISVDDQDSHQEFAQQLGLRFPLLSDDDPFGKTAKAYGVYDEEDHVAERALFVIDSQGTVRWRYIAPRGVNPGANGILEALESLK
jgi:peroxiredoxin (alkyl hydroperoxide reductase subunit C)